nr:insulinase family protein [Eubacterium sp.]
MKAVKGYRVLVNQELKELDAKGYLLEHEKTKAKIVAIECEDNNKVFSIGFRTPPKDSTGVAHIVEHTVLCGSKDFPVKDPFIELAKGSLNTFLNAMTYPDKTVYPVASCNDKDFQNLMHVYLDAVFYPNIYQEKKIFKQEGWHYELTELEGPLTYNGVVFNEMKGVFSSPEQLLDRKIQQSLFPDTPYGYESGGDPVDIPDLTYEAYLDFHSTYYHPSNSYIYLYGDMDMEEKLAWIDEKYLSQFEYLEMNSEITKQEAFERPEEVLAYYSLAEGEEEEGKTYLSYNAVVGTSLDRELYIAFQVLNYVLVQGIGAPVKQALMDAGIGSEISSFYEESICQPVFSITAKNSTAEKKDEFVAIIRRELEKIVAEGINQDSLNAGLNALEFRCREADFGSYPKGLMYGLQLMDSWLYDSDCPFIHLQFNETFAKLREKIKDGYFEKLIQVYLLDNTHRSIVVVEPKIGLTTQMDEQEAARLTKHLDTLSMEERQALIRETAELERYQEEPTPKELLEKIPLLSREDIGKKAQGFSNIEKEVAGSKVIHHNYFTNGIHYVGMLFDIKPLLKDYAPYISLLGSVIGSVDTDWHDKLAYSNEILQNAGDLTFSAKTIQSREKRGEYMAHFSIGTKVFADKLEKVFELIYEALSSSHLTDEKRLKEIIGEQRSSLQMRLIAAGHGTATGRGMAYISESGRYDEQFCGISYYRFLKWLDENFEEEKENLIAILKYLVATIFTKENVLTGVTCAEDEYSKFEEVYTTFVNKLDDTKQETISVPSKQPLRDELKENEGFKTAGQIQYVARVGNFMDKGIPYSGVYHVVKSLLSYEYLWNEVRVKGGAYGVMCGFANTGEGYFVSYRDPKLSETNEVYKGVPEYLRNFKADEREMTKYIIGTISNIDTPLTPRAKGARSMAAYLSGATEEQVQKDRDQILSATQEDIRQAADMVEAILGTEKICVLGNEEKVKENSSLFDVIDTIG